MKGKLKIIVPLVVLIALGGAYKVVLAKPNKHKPHIDGTVYVLPKEFLLNLSDGHFAKLDVALVLPDGAVPKGGEGGDTPPDGYGALPQEAAVRAVVTDTVTDAATKDLVTKKGRNALRAKLLKAIDDQTDVNAKEVLFTDVAVQ